MTTRLLWFLLLFYGSLGLGLTLRPWKALSPLIMRFTILLLETPIFIYSFWILDMQHLKQSAPIPLLSTLLVVLTLVLSPWGAQRLRLSRKAQGSFILAATFSNVGTTGGAFICYLLFGLPGLSLGYLYLLPYPIIIFTLGFSVAKHFASECRLSFRDYFTNIATNVISMVPLAAMALGLLLNLIGFQPSRGLVPWADGLIKLDLGIMCLAIGMTLRLPHLFSPWRPVVAVSAIKFLILPLLALIMVLFLYGSLGPLPAKVILIQSAMPPAIYAVITAHLFGLDRELVNSLWFSLTLLLIPVVLGFFLFWG